MGTMPRVQALDLGSFPGLICSSGMNGELLVDCCSTRWGGIGESYLLEFGPWVLRGSQLLIDASWGPKHVLDLTSVRVMGVRVTSGAADVRLEVSGRSLLPALPVLQKEMPSPKALPSLPDPVMTALLSRAYRSNREVGLITPGKAYWFDRADLKLYPFHSSDTDYWRLVCNQGINLHVPGHGLYLSPDGELAREPFDATENRNLVAQELLARVQLPPGLLVGYRPAVLVLPGDGGLSYVPVWGLIADTDALQNDVYSFRMAMYPSSARDGIVPETGNALAECVFVPNPGLLAAREDFLCPTKIWDAYREVIGTPTVGKPLRRAAEYAWDCQYSAYEGERDVYSNDCLMYAATDAVVTDTRPGIIPPNRYSFSRVDRAPLRSSSGWVTGRSMTFTTTAPADYEFDTSSLGYFTTVSTSSS